MTPSTNFWTIVLNFWPQVPTLNHSTELWTTVLNFEPKYQLLNNNTMLSNYITFPSTLSTKFWTMVLNFEQKYLTFNCKYGLDFWTILHFAFMLNLQFTILTFFKNNILHGASIILPLARSCLKKLIISFNYSGGWSIEIWFWILNKRNRWSILWVTLHVFQRKILK